MLPDGKVTQDGDNGKSLLSPTEGYTLTQGTVLETEHKGTVLCVDKKGKFWYNNQG